jgi:hypothetical protein
VERLIGRVERTESNEARNQKYYGEQSENDGGSARDLAGEIQHAYRERDHGPQQAVRVAYVLESCSRSPVSNESNKRTII